MSERKTRSRVAVSCCRPPKKHTQRIDRKGKRNASISAVQETMHHAMRPRAKGPSHRKKKMNQPSCGDIIRCCAITYLGSDNVYITVRRNSSVADVDPSVYRPSWCQGSNPLRRSQIQKRRYDSQCCICLEPVVRYTCAELEVPSARGVYLPCKHPFHACCLSQWLRSGKSSCPMCRASVPTRHRDLWS